MQRTLNVSTCTETKRKIKRPKSYRVEKGRKYEEENFFLRFLSIPVIVFLGILPAFLAQRIFLLFSTKNSDARVVFENVKTFRALEVIYTYRRRNKSSYIDSFWQNFLFNAASIRNRLILVKKEILACIQLVSEKKHVIRLLSVGSGSARPIFEAISTLRGVQTIETMLVDVDKNAIQFSQGLAHKLSLNHTQWQCGNFFRLEQYCKDFHPDIVEMVGLLDYLSDKQVVALLRKIFLVLAPNGYLITGNIAPNIESPFVTKGIHWPMTYRTPEHLANLLMDAGFLLATIEIVQEPLKIHTVAIAQKLLDP